MELDKSTIRYFKAIPKLIDEIKNKYNKPIDGERRIKDRRKNV